MRRSGGLWQVGAELFVGPMDQAQRRGHELISQEFRRRVRIVGPTVVYAFIRAVFAFWTAIAALIALCQRGAEKKAARSAEAGKVTVLLE